MRILKKSLSLLIALAMILSLVAMPSFAEGEELKVYMTLSKETIKTGGEFELKVFITNADGTDASVGMTSIEVPFDAEYFDAEAIATAVTSPITSVAGYNAAKGIISISRTDSSATTVGAAAPVLSATVKVKKVVESDDAKVLSISKADIRKPGGATKFTVDSTSTETLTIKPSFTATVATLDGEVDDVKAGTAKDTIIATLASKTATVAASDAADAKKDTGYATAGWDCADYNAEVPGTYTFTGKVTPDETKAGGWEGDLAVTATVDVTTLKTADISVETEAKKLEVKKGTAVSDVVALVKEAITKITFSDNGLTAEIAEDAEGLTYAQSAEITGAEEIGDTVTVTLTFAAVDGGVIFEDINGEKTITVKVVAAEIDNATVKIQGATTADDMVKVAVTLPEEALVTTGEGDAKVPTGTFTLAIDAGAAVLDTHTYEKSFEVGTAADVTVADGVASVTLTADKKLKDIEGIKTSVDEPFTVSVYYNGAALVVGKTDDNANIIGVSGKIMAAGGRDDVGGIGKPTNTPAPMTPVTPGTDEPGTDEPGTDAPGTDEPGTDEPGTDAPAVEGPFADVAADHWAASFIAALKDAGIIGGVNDTDFAPDNNITRAEYAKMIAGAFGLEATSAEVAFADCTADDWFTPFVAACVEAGYINGVSETEFAPNENITREQACAILGRALNVAGEGELTFTDVAEVEEYAKAFVAALAEMGIVNGYEDGTFAPKNNITRAEAAKIIAGVLAAQTEEAPVEEAPAAE